MSSRKYISPPNLLAEALDLAAPQLAERAISAAEENLAAMADTCRSRIESLLHDIDAMTVAVQNDDFNATVLKTYFLAVKLVGLGRPAGYPDLDVAAKSLCDVLDGLMVAGLPDVRFPTLVTVHTSAMRQLREPAILAEGAADLLSGLRALRSRFAVRPDEDSVLEV